MDKQRSLQSALPFLQPRRSDIAHTSSHFGGTPHGGSSRKLAPAARQHCWTMFGQNTIVF